MMRQHAVQPHPTPVTAAIETADVVPQFFRRLTVDRHVMLTTKLDRGAPHVDTHALAAAGAQAPDFSGGQRRSRDGRLRRRTDGK